MLKIIQDNTPWYSQGLHFKCTECGQCCTGAPGYIWVNEEEVQRIADFLNISLAELYDHYLRLVNGRLSLIEHPKTFDCVFLKDKKCQIYSVRPTQCRTFPWWPQNLKSQREWQEAARFCEGIHLEAPIVTMETIEQQLTLQNTIIFNEN